MAWLLIAQNWKVLEYLHITQCRECMDNCFIRRIDTTDVALNSTRDTSDLIEIWCLFIRFSNKHYNDWHPLSSQTQMLTRLACHCLMWLPPSLASSGGFSTLKSYLLLPLFFWLLLLLIWLTLSALLFVLVAKASFLIWRSSFPPLGILTVCSCKWEEGCSFQEYFALVPEILPLLA